MRKLVILFALMVSGCANQPEATFESNNSDSAEKIVNHLNKMAKKCWDRRPTPFRDGRTSRVYKKEDGFYVVTFNTYASDIGTKTSIAVEVTQDRNNTNIKLKRKEISHGFDGQVRNLNAAVKHVNKWIDGGTECGSGYQCWPSSGDNCTD